MEKNKIRKFKFSSKFNRKTSLIIIILLTIILIALVTIILFMMGIFGSKTIANNVYMEKNFTISDQCSLISGRIIHPLDREEDCTNKCRGTCEVENLVYLNSIFKLNTNSCNSCECFCK